MSNAASGKVRLGKRSGDMSAIDASPRLLIQPAAEGSNGWDVRNLVCRLQIHQSEFRKASKFALSVALRVLNWLAAPAAWPA